MAVDDVLEFDSGCLTLGIKPNSLQLEQFEIYFSELQLWNSRTNLTSITDREGIFIRHFLDSLTLLPVLCGLPLDDGLNLVDIGSGAGFPGLALKIMRNDIKLTLLEATGKKVRFLEHMVQTLGLDGVEVIHGRAEELAHQTRHRQSYRVVTARAVAALPALAELALPLCRPGGIFMAMKKGEMQAEIIAAAKAARLMGGALERQITIDLPGLHDGRSLIIYSKRSATPAAYPRRSGLPAKNPLI